MQIFDGTPDSSKYTTLITTYMYCRNLEMKRAPTIVEALVLLITSITVAGLISFREERQRRQSLRQHHLDPSCELGDHERFLD